jgi:site-specific recombinase
MDLADLLDTLDPDAALAQRHLWLMALLAWVRGDAHDLQASTSRVRLLLDAAQARPEWREQWRRWWRLFLQTVDLSALLADYGFAPRTAFLSEFGHRLRRKLLPDTPETTDLAELFGLLLPTRFDARWIQALDTQTLRRLQALLLEDPADAAQHAADAVGPWQGPLLDALAYSISQVGATGFASEIRLRMSAPARQARSFHALPVHFEVLRHAVLTHGAWSVDARGAADRLVGQLERCLADADTVYTHLESHGISVGIVFRLRQLRQRVERIRQLLDCLQSEQPERAATTLIADLVLLGHDNRSLRTLVTNSTQLTAAKVAERSAESGEHYITRDLAEYRAMVGKALGGGALLGLTTWVKFGLYGLALSAFWSGFAAGLNYALFFVLVQLLHWTVATKQPAVTAPAMAAKLRDIRTPGAVLRFVDEVAHLLRSQFAAIIGNVGAVIPTVLLISLALAQFHGAPMIDADSAHHVLHQLHLLGPTALFAAFTGVLLFASSIIAGWMENWFVLHKLDSAIAHNPRFTRALGRERAGRWAVWLRHNVSGLTANISLGFMLGIVPVVLAFFGLDIEVRHVTLSAGQVAAAAASLGWPVLREPAFWWAVAGVVVIGPLNLAVSFYLAFRLALKAQAISDVNRHRINAALRLRLRRAPWSFLWPPRPQDNTAVEDDETTTSAPPH